MEHLSKALAFMSRTAQSAQELLRDKDLRSKGIQTVVSGAQSRLQSIQYGIAQRAGQLGERLQERQRHFQALLANLEERLSSSQRAWQLQASRRQRVDVQFGRQLIADAPQEVRARLWYVLLENPHLAAPIKCQQPGPIPNRFSDDEEEGGDREGSSRGGIPDTGAGGGGSRSSSRLANMAAAALGFARGSDRSGHGGSSLQGSPSPPPSGPLHRDRSSGTPAPPDPTHQQQPQPQPPAQAAGGPGPEGQAGAAPAAPSPAPSLGTPLLGRTSRADASPAAGSDPCSGGEMDGWELVGGGVGPLPADGGAGAPGAAGAGGAAAGQPEAVRLILERLEALGPVPLDESGSDPLLVAQQAVLEAMLQVPPEAGVGLPAQAAPDCRFAMLNEMTAGQEEVDDSILRDIHRTFPEHPYFGMEAGQHALFRVLKAYSLHDLEVAYCQGMAFMAGVLLMYVPEELAFRLFCRLMDPEGPNLRRLYLPGLEPLKAELATFELLLTWRLPELAAHLTAFGLPPVLYVSQWLMTLFATPFPPPFCARVIDVLLQDGHDRLLLRCSFAVMEALEAELLARHDFEALITYLKMEPVSWGITRQRAIMERALTSPISDVEIDVARDTVGSRHLISAALAAGGGGGSLGAGSAGREADTAGQELLGAAAGGAAAGGAAAAPLPPQLSFEHEVEAALAAAAATLTAGGAVDGGGGRAPGTAEEGAAWREGPRCRGGSGDMISFDDERGAAWPEPAGQPSSQQRSSGGGAGACGSTALCSGGVAVNGGGSGAGMPPSLLDELDFAAAAAGAGPTHGSQQPAPELEYGEYGELLVDAGLLLPELGAAGEASAGLSATAVSGAAGVPSATDQRSRPQMGDLLLD